MVDISLHFPSTVASEQVIIISNDDIEMADNLAENPNAESASKFKLKFKAALSTKGRPRKHSKQLACFNKTRHDRKENEGKKRKAPTTAKQTKRKVNEVLVDMTTCNNEEEEFSGSKLLGNNQQGLLNLPQFSGDVLLNNPVEPPSVQPRFAEEGNHSISTITSRTAFAHSFTAAMMTDDYGY